MINVKTYGGTQNTLFSLGRNEETFMIFFSFVDYVLNNFMCENTAQIRQHFRWGVFIVF